MRLHPLNATELGVPTGAPEAAAIDALAMIFEAIFESPSLPDAVKSALASLQIPMLKAVMLDPALFTADAHPARQLLDKMARAAVGLPFDVSSRHPLCASIQQIASRVRAEFVNDTQVFLNHVGELDNLIAERDAATAQAAAAYRPLLQRLEKSDLAESRSREAVDQFCMSPDVPASIARFLREHWQRVLRQVWLEHGDESPEWQENTLVVDNLLWSIRPKLELEERKQLARVLPQMLQVLSTGMQRIALPEAVRAEFLDTCFALQTAAMRGAAAPASVADESPDHPCRTAGGQCDTGIQRTAGWWAVAQDISTSRVARGCPDDTVRFRCIPATGWRSVWLTISPCADASAASTRAAGSCCSPTRTGGSPCCCIRQSCESQLKEGEASVSSRVSLFNAAAEKALRRTPEAAQVRQS